MVGGPEEKAVNFQTHQGYLTNGEDHGTLLPHDVPVWYREGDGGVVSDPNITITMTQEVAAPKCGMKAKGKKT